MSRSRGWPEFWISCIERRMPAAWWRESRRWYGGLTFLSVVSQPLPGFRGSLLGLQEASPPKEAGRAECVGLHWGVLRLPTEILLEKRPWHSEARLGPAVAEPPASVSILCLIQLLPCCLPTPHLLSGHLDSVWGRMIQTRDQAREMTLCHRLL